MTDAREFLSGNERFVSGFRFGALPRGPRRGLALVTCMDARIDPLALLGLEVGDATVLRNAGALVTDDMLRSLTISHALLGVHAAVVIGHTECGLHGAANGEIAARLGGGEDVDFLPFADLDETVRAGVRRIRESELLPDTFAVEGYVYDVRSGRLHPL